MYFFKTSYGRSHRSGKGVVLNISYSQIFGLDCVFFLTHIKYIFKQTYKRTLYKLFFSDQGTNNIDSNARANATATSD